MNTIKRLLCLFITGICLYGLTGCVSFEQIPILHSPQEESHTQEEENNIKQEKTQNDSAIDIGIALIQELEKKMHKRDDINATTQKYNLVLFGVDSRDRTEIIGDKSRSDTIMLVSIDKKTNQIQLISVMRDSKVNIEGYGEQKINAAYAFGGHDLALQTLNQTFHLDVKDYMTVDFSRFSEIIDILGGVDIELSEEEANLIPENNGIQPTTGLNHLNGDQAIAYSRIRAIDSDVNRVSRQQKVIQQVLSNFKKIKPTDYVGVTLKILNCVDTSLPLSYILSILTQCDVQNMTMHIYTVPSEKIDPNLWGGIDESGQWVWKFDIEKTADYIHSLID